MRRLLFLSALAFAAPAFADDTIVVTAERRAQDLITLPSNAAALDAEDLATIGAQAPSEVLNRLPGVAIHRGSGVESLPAIRSPVLTGGQGAGSFLVLEDGVPIRAPGFANINETYETSLDFAHRVEVTRGPGSALHGSNAVHGVVNVVTPIAGRTSLLSGAPYGLTIDAGAGSFGRYSGAVAARFGARWLEVGCPPSTETELYLHCRTQTPVRGLLAASFAHEDGWRDNAGLDEQHVLVGVDTEYGDWNFTSRLAFVNLQQETAGFVEGTDAYRSETLSRANANPEAYRNSKVLRAQMALTRGFGDVTLQVTPFARWIDTDLLQHFFPSRALEETEQTGGGVQTTLYWDADVDLNFIVGFDVDRTSGSLREFQSRATQPAGYVQGLHYDYEVDATVLALYGQASWAFTRQWRVVAGVRGERSEYDYDNLTASNDVGRFRRAADRSDEFETLTPKLGLIYAPNGGATVWLNLARGARAPQVSDLYSLQTLQNPGDQKAETIDSAELGWRAAWDMGPLRGARVEVALYSMEKKNSAFRNADGFTVPFAKTQHQGIELSGALPLGPQLELSGWATYAEHTYRFSDPVTRAGESIVSGTDIDSAPRHLANAQLTWRPNDVLSAEIGWTHMGEYLTNAAGTRRYPGHDIFDLHGAWSGTANADISLAVRNIADERYAERADFAFGVDRYFPAESRAFTVGVRARR